jgi:hypothetical protein
MCRLAIRLPRVAPARPPAQPRPCSFDSSDLPVAFSRAVAAELMATSKVLAVMPRLSTAIISSGTVGAAPMAISTPSRAMPENSRVLRAPSEAIMREEIG